MNTNNMDFVYIIKPGEKGIDLRYSLRSIAKYYPNNKVWIIGYKPAWVTNVEYLPVEQKGTKWANSTLNVIKACECPNISDNFILMNDDFFAISPILPLEKVIDSNLGKLDDIIIRYKSHVGGWADGFAHIKNLLNELGIRKPLYSYEAHLPIKINKQKFLEVINLPLVQEFMKTSKVLHKRTLYKNYDKPKKPFILSFDVKVTEKRDDSLDLLKICGWLSVADNIVNNSKFKDLNTLLNNTLSQPCKYELQNIKIHKKEKYF